LLLGTKTRFYLQVFFGRRDQEAAAAARRQIEDALAGAAAAAAAEGDGGTVADGPEDAGHKPLQMLRIWVLREYLQVRNGHSTYQSMLVT
jgi:hypothetical protein